MFGQRVNLEWKMGETPDGSITSRAVARSPLDWPSLDQTPAPWAAPYWLADEGDLFWGADGHDRLGRSELWQTLRTMGLFCLALLLMSSATITPEQRVQIAAQQGIHFSLGLEKAAWQTNDKALYHSLVDSDVELRWINEWRDLWRLDIHHRQEFGTVLSGIQPLGNPAAPELVEAQVTITRPSVDWWRSSPYTERRFYRQTESGWVRTMPGDAYWGAEQSIETAHIRFSFRTLDRENVLPIAAKIEQIYVESRQVMNLSPPSATQKLHIIVTPEMIRRWYYNRNQVQLTSPIVSKVSVGLTEAEYLAQVLADLLSYRAVENAATNGQSNFYQWGMMIWGISGWLRSELLGQRSPWDQQATVYFHQYATLPLELEKMTNWRSDEPPTRELLMAQYVAAESIVDYIAFTYGRDRLPLLLDALGQYRQWDQLVEDLFGISQVEFEAGWNQHLKERYGKNKQP